MLLGTLLCSVLLNLATLVCVGREEEGGGTVRAVKLRVRSWNLAAIGLSFLLTGILLGYAFVENFGAQIRLTRAEPLRVFRNQESLSTIRNLVRPQNRHFPCIP